MILRLKILQVTNIAVEEILDPMADQVTMMEPELSLCVFVECCSHLTHSEFLASLVICIHATVGLWRMEFECSLW